MQRKIADLIKDNEIGLLIENAVRKGSLSINGRLSTRMVKAIRDLNTSKKMGGKIPTYEQLERWTTSPNSKKKIIDIVYAENTVSSPNVMTYKPLDYLIVSLISRSIDLGGEPEIEEVADKVLRIIAPFKGLLDLEMRNGDTGIDFSLVKIPKNALDVLVVLIESEEEGVISDLDIQFKIIQSKSESVSPTNIQKGRTLLQALAQMLRDNYSGYAASHKSLVEMFVNMMAPQTELEMSQGEFNSNLVAVMKHGLLPIICK